MRFPLGLLSTLAVLVGTVAAGGYQGCLERVFSFQAYQLDALNPTDKQLMGFRCRTFQAHECKDNVWIPCSGSAVGGRCNFYEFLRHMGRLPNQKDWARFQTGSTTRLDHDATAARCLLIYQTMNGNKKTVRNFPAYQAMKNQGEEWNKYVRDVAALVDSTAQHHQTEDNHYLWDDFDATRDRIIAIRAGDHGEKLIAAARAALEPDIQIKTRNLGPHPDPNKVLESMDWKATVQAAKNAGVPDYKARLGAFYNHFYGAMNDENEYTEDATKAREHRALNRSYKKMVDRSNKCRH